MKRGSARRRRVALASAFAIGASAIAMLAYGQQVDPQKPRTFAIGAPLGASIAPRVDAKRTGKADDLLPHPPLKVLWKKSTSVTVENAPLVLRDGAVVVVTTRGDAFFWNADGSELARVSTAEPPMSAPVILSSGNIAYLSASGRAVIFSTDRVLRSELVVHDRAVRVTPLALTDGGFVVATLGELVVLDAEGSVRARGALPVTATGALISNGREILATGNDGTVYAWTPGDEPHRVGSFDGAIDGNAALAQNGTLYGVSRTNHLLAIDLAHGGGTTTLAVAPVGIFLGPPAIRPGAISVFAYTPINSAVVTFAPEGHEISGARVSGHAATTLPDGGAPVLTAPPHTGMIIDDSGAIAFMSPEGAVGVVAADGSVSTLGDSPCGLGVGRRTMAQLAPAGPGAFVLACETGAVAKIASGGFSPENPARGAPSAGANSSSSSSSAPTTEKTR